jgi:hypothetical protein
MGSGEIQTENVISKIQSGAKSKRKRRVCYSPVTSKPSNAGRTQQGFSTMKGLIHGGFRLHTVVGVVWCVAAGNRMIGRAAGNAADFSDEGIICAR